MLSNCLDDSDEGVYEQGDPSAGDVADNTPPLEHVKKYAESENVYTRQMVSRVLLELFKLGPVDGLTQDFPQIMDVVSRLVEGEEIMVCTSMLEQLPNLALLGVQCSERVPILADIVGDYILPLVVRNLGTSKEQVRKSAHQTLFSLMEQGLVTKAQAEIQVCPTILALSRKECLMYYHTDAIALMCKLVSLVGRDVTERVFLDRFLELCADQMFYVRRVCAAHFGDFCAVVGKQSYEKLLLPAFINLCNDDAWGVRKACADVAMCVSCACSPMARRNVLAPVYAKFLQDDNRWVRSSAFQTLGPFISTFADPTITSLAYNNMGELVLVSTDGSEFKINSTVPLTEDVKHMYYIPWDDGKAAVEAASQLFMEYPTYDKQMKEIAGMEATSNDIDSTIKNLVDIFQVVGSENEIETEQQSVVEVSGEPLIKDDRNDEEGSFSNVNIDDVVEMYSDHCVTDDETKKKNAAASGSANCEQGERTNLVNSAEKAAAGDNVVNAEQKENQIDCDISAITDQLTNVDLSNGNQVNQSLSQNGTEATEARLDNGNDKAPTVQGKDEEGVDNLYNSYNYWYVPPDLPLDPSVVNAQEFTTANETALNASDEQSAASLNDTFNKSMNTTHVLDHSYVKTDNSSDDLPEPNAELTELKEPSQHIVPQLLIDHFISMTDPNTAQCADDNIIYHCAYSLPAVALTLGSSNFHLLKGTVKSLAENMQYKVRRTLASSLHELAEILGPESAFTYLTPIFNGFIKDLDEVRIGILKHLAHFLKLISPTKRLSYLPRLTVFLQNHHELNWRFRHEFAEQLLQSVTLFPPVEASKHITLIAQILLYDKVSAVREVALTLVCELMKHIGSEPGLMPMTLVRFAEKFAHSKKWKMRQTFVLLSAELLSSNALPIEQFASEVMPHLLDLSWDPVANVRLVVGRTITQNMIENEYLSDPENQHNEMIQKVLQRLQNDKDNDVRQSAQYEEIDTEVS